MKTSSTRVLEASNILSHLGNQLKFIKFHQPQWIFHEFTNKNYPSFLQPSTILQPSVPLWVSVEAMGCGASAAGDAGTQNARHSEDLTYWPQQEMKCDASG